MIALATLLIQAGTTPSLLPPVEIDPCVAVDPEEVRRLTTIEVGSLQSSASERSLRVIVDCEASGQRLRLVDPLRGVIAARRIDLSASQAGDLDAKARELALAIAELFRRSQADSSVVPTETMPVGLDEPSPKEPEPRSPQWRPWQLEIGGSGAVAGFSAGELLLGTDMTGRVRLGRFLLAELRAGARQTTRLELERGSMAGRGFVAMAGLSFDALPDMRWAGVSFGARVEADWLSYEVADDAGITYGRAQAQALTAAGATTAFVSVAEPLCLTLDAAVGMALYPVIIRENEHTQSGLRGVAWSFALGLAAHL